MTRPDLLPSAQRLLPPITHTPPHRRWFEDAIRARFPLPQQVFFSIKRQVWSIGDSSLSMFLDIYCDCINMRQGIVRTRGGDVFFRLTPIAMCDHPAPRDVMFHISLEVNESLRFAINPSERY